MHKLEELNQAAEDPHLWDHQEKARILLQERDSLSQIVTKIQAAEDDVQNTLDFLNLAEDENDIQALEEGERTLVQLDQSLERLRIESLLRHEADTKDAYLEINAGAGGTEAHDWALMLQRMYSRWAEQHPYKVTLIAESVGEEAGINSCTLQIQGHQAYGWLKKESGVHRLVRISPFDSSARRHTSFASVWVYPVVDENFHIQVEDKDVRIDTFRASGAGGQHVNTTDSAIRITHIPTGIVVQCQTQRSQHKNRAQAMAMLKSRLYDVELRKKEEQAQTSHSEKKDIGWGNQIRSYVLHPYQMVKDLRTGVEKGHAQGVLDGDLTPYLEAALAQDV